MYSAFLLRFQESCALVSAADPNCGTKTGTAIHAEGPDADPTGAGRDGRTFPMTPAALDGTKTAIEREQADTHWGIGQLDAFPKAASLQTGTITFVKAEAADKDQSGYRHQAIPRCSLS